MLQTTFWPPDPFSKQRLENYGMRSVFLADGSKRIVFLHIHQRQNPWQNAARRPQHKTTKPAKPPGKLRPRDQVGSNWGEQQVFLLVTTLLLTTVLGSPQSKTPDKTPCNPCETLSSPQAH